MLLENLQVQRVIVHEVFRLRDDRTAAPPNMASAVTELEDVARDYFVERIVAVMGSSAHCMDMAFANPIQPTMVASRVHELVAATDTAFVQLTGLVAQMLANAQSSRAIPGGMVIAFSGTVGAENSAVFGVLKSELHSSFLQNRGQIQLLERLFLGPQTKLFKVGVFKRLGGVDLPAPSGWAAAVFDSQMTGGNRDSAAYYFYNDFLGLAFPDNAAYSTRRFFEATRAFINSLDVDDETKADLSSGLYTYLKVDQSQTIHPSSFATQFLDPDLHDGFRRHLEREQISDTATAKDTSEIQQLLRRRKVSFRGNIQLVAPSDAFGDLIDIETIDAPGGDGRKWTRITVHDVAERHD
jgi:hypothetical protein